MTAIRPPACVTPLLTKIRKRARADLSTPICMTAIQASSFSGEPKKVAISGDIDSFTQLVWESLNEENKVSLFVRYIDIETGKIQTRIVNKTT